jgi:hypothetical protein
MHFFNIIALFVGTKTVYAACTGPLVIDEFSRWSSNLNSLNEWVSGMFPALLTILYLTAIRLFSPHITLSSA